MWIGKWSLKRWLFAKWPASWGFTVNRLNHRAVAVSLASANCWITWGYEYSIHIYIYMCVCAYIYTYIYIYIMYILCIQETLICSIIHRIATSFLLPEDKTTDRTGTPVWAPKVDPANPWYRWPIYKGFSMAMLVITKWYIIYIYIYVYCVYI